MEHDIAVDLIRNGVRTMDAQQWADLGAGGGVFTLALASLLQPGSVVFAIDKSAASLNALQTVSETPIKKIVGDFSDEQVVPSGLDGIVLANALHYIEDKGSLLGTLIQKLNRGGRIIVIEYDLEKPNPWVPFPLPFRSLLKLTQSIRLSTPNEIGRVPSRLNTSELYSAIILK